MAFLEKIKLSLFLILSCVVCIVFLLFPGYARSSTTIKNLKQQQEQVKQKQENVIQEQKRLNNLQNEAEKNLQSVNQNIQNTNIYIQNSEIKLQQATENLQRLEAELLITERDYQNRQAETIARLRFLQRAPIYQGWAVLLQSENINDFISRRHQLKLVYQADQKILNNLANQGKLLVTQKTAVEKQKNLIAIIREQLLAQKADYQNQAIFQTELIQRLNNDKIALEAAQNQLQEDSENLEKLIQEKIAEQKRLAEQQAARAKTASKIYGQDIQGTGIFKLPSDAPMSSPFGWRIHPILGYRRFHSGLDFAANYGAVIRASDSGVVIFAGWYGGYGKAVIISHGKDISTLYGHTSELYVSEGQGVKRGQAIAAVGSTGLSTGPHLHFEVRRNGTPIDPANYL